MQHPSKKICQATDPYFLRHRQILKAGASFILSAMTAGTLAKTSDVAGKKITQNLRIVIPANPGGGWDQTGRTLGAAMLESGLVENIVFENIGGKGGINGLEQYATKYAEDPDTLMVGGMVMVGALELHKPSVNLKSVAPLARIASDYVVLAMRPEGASHSAKDFLKALSERPDSLVIAGGSAGGVDHMFAGMLAFAAKVPMTKLKYKPFSGGGDVVKAALAGEAQAVVSGYSELAGAFKAGQLKPIGISSRNSLLGLSSFREQGVDADIANWRAIFTGSRVNELRKEQLIAALESAIAHETWRKALQTNGWGNAWQTGKALDAYIEMQTTTAQVMNFMLKMKS